MNKIHKMHNIKNKFQKNIRCQQFLEFMRDNYKNIQSHVKNVNQWHKFNNKSIIKYNLYNLLD